MNHLQRYEQLFVRGVPRPQEDDGMFWVIGERHVDEHANLALCRCAVEDFLAEYGELSNEPPNDHSPGHSGYVVSLANFKDPTKPVCVEGATLHDALIEAAEKVLELQPSN